MRRQFGSTKAIENDGFRNRDFGSFANTRLASPVSAIPQREF
jgi:hypothetical protein